VLRTTAKTDTTYHTSLATFVAFNFNILYHTEHNNRDADELSCIPQTIETIFMKSVTQSFRSRMSIFLPSIQMSYQDRRKKQTVLT